MTTDLVTTTPDAGAALAREAHNDAQRLDLWLHGPLRPHAAGRGGRR